VPRLGLPCGHGKQTRRETSISQQPRTPCKKSSSQPLQPFFLPLTLQSHQSHLLAPDVLFFPYRAPTPLHIKQNHFLFPRLLTSLFPYTIDPFCNCPNFAHRSAPSQSPRSTSPFLFQILIAFYSFFFFSSAISYGFLSGQVLSVRNACGFDTDRTFLSLLRRVAYFVFSSPLLRLTSLGAFVLSFFQTCKIWLREVSLLFLLYAISREPVLSFSKVGGFGFLCLLREDVDFRVCSSFLFTICGSAWFFFCGRVGFILFYLVRSFGPFRLDVCAGFVETLSHNLPSFSLEGSFLKLMSVQEPVSGAGRLFADESLLGILWLVFSCPAISEDWCDLALFLSAYRLR